jgi:hypothetical protein
MDCNPVEPHTVAEEQSNPKCDVDRLIYWLHSLDRKRITIQNLESLKNQELKGLANGIAHRISESIEPYGRHLPSHPGCISRR